MRDSPTHVELPENVLSPPHLDVWSADHAGVLERFQTLRHTLNATAERIWRFTELDAHIVELERMIFALDDHGMLAEMFLASLSSAQISLQQVAYCQWETELERRFVHALESGGSIDDYALAPRFRRLLERELELLAPGGRPERLLFIGSGPLPISAILAHEYLHARVDCLDLDRVAVSHSRRLLDTLHLSDALEVFHGDGCGYDASAYDAVLIALLAKPKHEILASVAERARPDCRIICRTSHGLRRLIYEPLRVERDIRLHVVADSRAALGDGDTISSLLLVGR